MYKHFIEIDPVTQDVLKTFSDATEAPGPYSHFVESSLDPIYNPNLFSARGIPLYTWNGSALIAKSQETINEAELNLWYKPQYHAKLEHQLEETLTLGFTYGGVTFQADQISQNIANAYLTALTANLPITFPIVWRTANNTFYSFTDLEAFKTFSMYMLGFGQQSYAAMWVAKQNLIAITSIEELIAQFGTP